MAAQPIDSPLGRLGPDEKVLAGCSLLTLVVSVLPWWSMEHLVKVRVNAFDTTWGVIAFLGALATLLEVVGVRERVLKLQAPVALRLPLLAAGLSALAILSFILSGPGGDVEPSGELGEALGIEAGKTLWPWVAFLAMGIATFVAYRRVAAHSPATDASSPPG